MIIVYGMWGGIPKDTQNQSGLESPIHVMTHGCNKMISYGKPCAYADANERGGPLAVEVFCAQFDHRLITLRKVIHLWFDSVVFLHTQSNLF